MNRSELGAELVIVAGVDPIARPVVGAGLIVGQPDAALLDYRRAVADPGSTEPVALRRRVSDHSGVVYDDLLDTGPSCLCCRLSDDLVQTLRTLVDTGRWRRVVLVLPEGSPLGAVTDQLAAAARAELVPGLRLSTALVAVDLSQVVDELLGDDLLDERGLALSPVDRRAVGEALAEHLDVADAVVSVGPDDPSDHTASALVETLVGDR